MSEERKPIVVVKPGALSPSSRQALQRGGYIIIEAADPADISILQAVYMPMNENAVFYAAMDALSKGYSYGHFGKSLAEVLAASTKPSTGTGE